MKWVKQEHANGCALATVAMLTGRTYSEIHALAEFYGIGTDWENDGVSHYEVDRLLAHHGLFIQRRYVSYREFQVAGWPPRPWARKHYASVQQPSGRGHFVAMDGDGCVFDPMREGTFSLADWEKVNQVVAVQ